MLDFGCVEPNLRYKYTEKNNRCLIFSKKYPSYFSYSDGYIIKYLCDNMLRSVIFIYDTV